MFELITAILVLAALFLYARKLSSLSGKAPPVERVEDASTYGLRLFYVKLWPAFFREFPPGVEPTRWGHCFRELREKRYLRVGDTMPLFWGFGRVFHYTVRAIGPEAPPWADTICSHRTYNLDFSHIEVLFQGPRYMAPDEPTVAQILKEQEGEDERLHFNFNRWDWQHLWLERLRRLLCGSCGGSHGPKTMAFATGNEARHGHICADCYYKLPRDIRGNYHEPLLKRWFA